MNRKVWMAMGMAFGTNVIFGFSFLFSKIAMETAKPLVLLSVRFTVAFLIMSLLLLTGVCRVHYKGKRLMPLLVMGLMQPVLYFVFESYGIRYSSSSFAGIMIALSPIASMIFSALLLKEKPLGKQVVFSLVSIGGVIFLTLAGGGETSNFQWKGFLFLVGAVLSGALYGIQSRKIAEEFTSFERTYMMFVLGMVVFNIAGLVTTKGQWNEYLIPLSSGRFWFGVLYLGGVSSVGAFLLLNQSLNVLDVTRMTVFANVSTVISLFAGIIILKESFSPVQLIGVAFVILGVYGVNRFTADSDTPSPRKDS